MHCPMLRFLFVALSVYECSCSDVLCLASSGTDATYNETLEYDSSTGSTARRIVSTGCPNYISVDGAYQQDKDYLIQAYPCFSDSPVNVTCVGGSVGITLNGLSITSRYVGGDNCSLDAAQEEGDTFDACGGHMNEGGMYHYHVAPSCLIAQLNGSDDANVEHSPLIGWAFDGFPVYGPYGPSGVEMYVCGHSDADDTYCLDECGGTDGYTIDDFLYHYHYQGPLSDLSSTPLSPLAGTDRSPHTVGCLKGVPLDWSILSVSDNNGSCSSDGFTANYTPTATEGVTSVYTVVTNDPTAAPIPTPDPTTSNPSESPTATGDPTTTPGPTASGEPTTTPGPTTSAGTTSSAETTSSTDTTSSTETSYSPTSGAVAVAGTGFGATALLLAMAMTAAMH